MIDALKNYAASLTLPFFLLKKKKTRPWEQAVGRISTEKVK
jgi:hypothetical protein